MRKFQKILNFIYSQTKYHLSNHLLNYPSLKELFVSSVYNIYKYVLYKRRNLNSLEILENVCFSLALKHFNHNLNRAFSFEK